MKTRPSPPRQQRLRFCVQLASALALRLWGESARLLRSYKKRPPLTRRALDELLIHAGLVLGYPVMIEAFSQTLSIVGPTSGAAGGRVRTSLDRSGRRILRQIYGTQTNRLLENLGALHPSLPRWIVRDVYGKVFARPGLSIQDRELLTVVLLVTQGLETQLYSHLRGALKVKVDPQDLRYALHLMKRRYHIPVTYAMKTLEELCRKPDLCR